MYLTTPFDASSLELTADEKKGLDDAGLKKKLQAKRTEEYGKRVKDGKEISYEEKTEKDKYSSDIKELVKGLLTRDPANRLGSENDSVEILEHKAFKLLTELEDGSPEDKGFEFQKPDLFNLKQDFDLKKEKKDKVLKEAE